MADAAEHDLKISTLAGANPPASAVGAARPGLEQVVTEHLDEITRLAYRLLGWQSDVEDIVQDVFLSAAQKLDTLRDETCVRAWLYRITVNKCRTWRYRQKLRWRFWESRRTDQEMAVSDSHGDGEERDAEVRRAVRALPAKYREVVVLKYLEQLSGSQVATMLGINENTLNVRLLRARTMLRETLENET